MNDAIDEISSTDDDDDDQKEQITIIHRHTLEAF